MKRLLLILLAALAVGAFGSTAVAQAGCLAVAGFPSYDSSGSIKANAGIDCTTNNGSGYTVRAYEQGNSTGSWVSVNLNQPFTFSVSNPPNNYSSTRLWFMQCSFFAPADNAFRQKVVVENNTSGTKDTDYSSVNSAMPITCQ